MTATLEALPISKALPLFLSQYAQCTVLRPLITDGDETQHFWPDALMGEAGFRIPEDRKTAPHFEDGPDSLTLDFLASRVTAAGVTGFNYVQKKSRFFIYDYDAKDHNEGNEDDAIDAVVEAARRLGWVHVRRSKGGRGIHLIVILSEPMDADNGTHHQANSKAVLARMSADADFDFSEHLDCGGVVGFIYAAGELPDNAFDLIVEASTEAPVIEQVEAPEPRPTKAPACDFGPEHQAFIDKIAQKGYVAIVENGYLKSHAKAFELLGDPSYQTNSPGKNPAEPNCFAYPTADGFIVNRFAVLPGAEAAGWQANAQGFAMRRVRFPVEMSRTPMPEAPLPIHDELRLAKSFAIANKFEGYLTVVYFDGDWYRWDGGWKKLKHEVFINELYAHCKAYIIRETEKVNKAIREQNAREDKAIKERSPAAFGTSNAKNVEMALRSMATIHEPGWVDGRGGNWIAFRNVIFNVDSWCDHNKAEVIKQTPAYFSPAAIDRELIYTEDEPKLLLESLRQQFDEDGVKAYQEFGGYCMTTLNDIQRIVIVIGPPRSFKGTGEKVIRYNAGDHNCVSKTLVDFIGAHALEDLPGKTFLGISDSRPDPRMSRHAVERLLSISGGDSQNINPKGKAQYTSPLALKIMLCSNVVPAFSDPTGALLSRFLFLKTTKSFVGNEDATLLQRILAESNATTWWFLHGLQRLMRQGKYTEPKTDLKQKFEDQNNPVVCFVKQRCELNSAATIDKGVLFMEFCDWCEERQVAEKTLNVFVRELLGDFQQLEAGRRTEKDSRIPIIKGIEMKKRGEQ